MASIFEADDSVNSDSDTSDGTRKPQLNAGVLELKRQLSECLEDTNGNCSGSFAYSGALSTAPNPGLSVNGLGTIGLPLDEREAAKLRNACHQAPYCKGSETIVDTSNPTWQVTLDQALQQAAQALSILGGSTAVRAELYKLLLYDEGAFLKAIPKKASGMIGTLVIALPSEHTGGEVAASFGGRKLFLETAGFSKDGNSCLAWYSDVEHAVRRVISGHRLVLTYNLIQAVGPLQIAAKLEDNQARLLSILAMWNDKVRRKSEGSPRYLAYMLDHKYTDANLKLDHLKGNDAYRARPLQAACQDQGFCFLLANIECTGEGSCEETYDPYDHYGGRRGYNWKDDDDDDDDSSNESEDVDHHELEEVSNTSLTLRTLIRANGQRRASGIPMKERDIVQDDPFDGEPDSEDYEGYTGGAGASATHFYRNSCIVIMPQQHQTAFLLDHAKKGDVDMEAWVGAAMKEVNEKPGDDGRSADLTELCEAIVKACAAKRKEEEAERSMYSWGDTKSALNDAALGLVARESLQLRQPVLFETAVATTKECLPMGIYPIFGQSLGELAFEQWQKGLDLALNRICKVYQRWEAVTGALQACKACPPSLWSASIAIDDLESLVRNSIEGMMSTEVDVYKEDAQALMEMTETYGQGFLFKHILPFVKKHVSNAAFTTTFLILLYEAEGNGAVRDGVAKNIYRDVFADLLPSFKLEELSLMEATEIARLIDHCRSMGLSEEQEALKGQLVTWSKAFDPSVFECFFIPLLARLVETSRSNNIPLNESNLRHFFKSILETYVRQFIGIEAAKPRNWTQARRGCSRNCGDCSTLSAFLTSPNEKVGRFPIAEKRRRHLESQLYSTGCALDTERRGSPYTLVVTKTLKSWHEKHKAWKEWCSTAGQSFRTIGIDALKAILQEDYGACLDVNLDRPGPAGGEIASPGKEPHSITLPRVPQMNTWHTARAATAVQRTPLGSLAQPGWLTGVRPPPGMVQQTDPASKVSFIDLTSD